MSLNLNSLEAVAEAMVAPEKGILAADESTGTIGKRLAQIDAESTFESRNAYRDLLFSAEGMENYISGVIMYDETLRQSSLAEGTPYPEYLAAKGVIPGIKVDAGAHDLSGSEGEKITSGLDGLKSIVKWVHGLPSGGPLSILRKITQVDIALALMPMLLPAMQHYARPMILYPSLNRKSSWMVRMTLMIALW